MSQDNSIFGLLVGAAIGAGIGILFAPDKGSATRQRIADEALAAKDKLEAEATVFRDKMANTIATNKQTLEERLEQVANDASYKAEDVITSLEMKLKDLKARNKKYQKAQNGSV